MAYDGNEQFAATDPISRGLRVEPKTIQPKTFATGSGTLAALTPVAYNTSTNKWVVWTNGGSNGTGTVSGFIFPDAVTLNASKEVIGQVLIQGKIHYSDIVLPENEVEANLKTALRSGPRGLGLIIQGLDLVR